MKRCTWCNLNNPKYIEYHDYEWGKLNIDEGKSYQQRNLSMQALLNYDRTFGIHTVSGMLMANRDELTISGHNLPYFNIGMGGRFTYAYDQKYIGEFTTGPKTIHQDAVSDSSRQVLSAGLQRMKTS